jgi:NAD(P)-dependent dehydrogenase (short-subunit alcohol dehydrogenase family)
VSDTMTGQLEGRTALITGASQGTGKVIALRFAREGAKVVLAARSRERLEETAAEITAAGGTAVVAPTDLRQVAEVEALAQRIEAGGDGLDVIVSNSGIAGPTAELWKVEPEEWEETMRVNVTGTFLLCRSLLPAMVRRGSGSVVVIGSATGKRPLYGRTPYAASKMALVGLVRTLAVELGPAGVRVNLLSPGGVAGPRIETVIREQARATGSSREALYEEYTKSTPLRRLVPPEDIASAALFLASDASASITGEDMNVSAGLTMY